MSKYTLGPWTLRDGIISNDRRIAKIHYEYERYGEPVRSEVEAEDDANARLIAAAPDLLEACKRIVVRYGDDCGDHCTNTCPVCGCREAIAKAEGQ